MPSYYYTLHFEANGGTGAPADTTSTATFPYSPAGSYIDASRQIPGTIPTRTGYSFVNWKRTKYDADTYWNPGDYPTHRFISNGSSDQYHTDVFYAQWRAATYTISYNANGGSGAPSAQTKTHGVNLTLSSTVPTRTNYIFQGWATSSTGAVQYQPGGTFTANANTILYAIWKQAAATLDSVSDTAIGSNGTASWTKINEAHTYKLVLSVGVDTSVEIDNIAAGSSSVGFTIPSSWLSALPNSTSATATATLYTYNNGTLVGSTSKSFTVSVPSTVKPSISAFTAVPHSANNTVEGWGVAVQGYSYLTLDVTATAGTGASIANISFTGHGITQSSAATTGNTAVVTSTGTLTYNVTVTDSRGRTESTTVNITVYEYANPTINSLESVRCYSNGTPSDTEGDYIKSFPVFVFSSVNGNNSLSVKKLEYREHGAGSWATATSSAVSGAWSAVFGPADITKSFDVKLTVTDAIGNTYSLEVTVPSVVGYAFGLKNDRVRFGGPVRRPGFECDFPAQFDSTVDVIQRRCSATLSSAGWYRVFLYSSTNDDELAGSKSANIRITITREGIVGNSFRNEVHFIDFSLAYGSYIFSNETSVTQSFAIDKIRYGYDLTNHFGFIDVHCKRNDSNPITVSFNVATDLETQGEMASVEPYSVADAPSGETVVTTYTFNKNNGNPLVFKSQYYASVSLYNASGSFVNELRWQENEDDSIWILSGYATLTVTARNGGNPGLTINLPSTFKGQSAQYRVGSQTQYQKEHLYLQLTNGSSTCLLRTSESWNNLSTGEVRFYVYQTIIFNR